LLHIELRGDIDSDTLGRAATLVRQDEGASKVEVSVAGGIETKHFFSIAEGAAIVQCIALLAKAIVYCYKEFQQNRKWDKNRLLAFIEEELLKRGVTDYIVDEIQGFECLLGTGECPCRVTVLSATEGKGYTVLIFRNGDSFVVEFRTKLGLL
jgi:hypothetical protein